MYLSLSLSGEWGEGGHSHIKMTGCSWKSFEKHPKKVTKYRLMGVALMDFYP